jgi:hypothetical protein
VIKPITLQNSITHTFGRVKPILFSYSFGGGQQVGEHSSHRIILPQYFFVSFLVKFEV